MGPSALCPQACGIIPPVFPWAGGAENSHVPTYMGCGGGEGTLAGGTVPGSSPLPTPRP